MAYTYRRLSQPDRTEISDEQGWAATFTDNSRTVSLRGPQRTFTELSAGISDQFARTVTGGWGGTPAGGRWYSAGGTPASYWTDGTSGLISVTSANAAYRMLITNPHKDIDVRVRMRITGDSGGLGVQQGLVFGYSDTNNYYMATMSVVAGNVADAFNRTVSDGWGKASSGQGWTQSGGASGDYLVSNSTGYHRLGAVNSSLRNLVTASADFDCTVKVSVNALAQGSSLLTSIIGRYQDPNNYYNFRVRYASAPAARPIFVSIQKQYNGLASTIGSEAAAGIDHTADSFVWVRATASGDTLRMKIWAASAEEPASWHLEVTDATFRTGGQAGVRSLISAGSTNPLPVTVSYRSFSLKQLHTPVGCVQVSLLKRASGITKTVASTILDTLPYVGGTFYWLRVSTAAAAIKIRLWKDGSAEPASWHISQAVTSGPSGLVGPRAYCTSEAPVLPVSFSFDNYLLTGVWSKPPVVRHTTWVRLLPAPFAGTVDEAWLASRLSDATADILAIGTQYLTASPPVVNGDGVQIAGDANYSSLYADGGRRSGGDFNDYLGQDWRYSATSLDQAKPLFFKCMDCAGFVRMVFGYRSGYPFSPAVSTGKLPRSPYDLGYNAPGVAVASNASSPPPTAAMQPGDMLYFCKATGDPNTVESQVDHVGIYLGRDTGGHDRFISSRRAINGPTFADIGGPSTLDGSEQYARTLRLIRRL